MPPTFKSEFMAQIGQARNNPHLRRVTEVTKEFAQFAQNGNQLALVANTLSGWLAQRDNAAIDGIDKTDAGLAVNAIFATAFNRPETMPAVLGAFAADDRESTGYGLLRRYISRSLGKLLIGHVLSGTGPNKTTNLDTQLVIGTVDVFDHRGLLSDDFWVRYGVHAKAGLITPDFLPLLYQKSVGPSSDRIIGCEVKEAAMAAGSYMTAVLQSYNDKADRHQPSTQAILSSARITRKESIYTDVGWQQMIRLSNAQKLQIARRRNNTSVDQLSENNFHNTDDAFLYMLQFTHSRDTEIPH